MQRKILGICAALVAFGAFAVLPAIGSAATLTETTAGGAVDTVAAGKTIIGSSTGTSLLKGGLQAECNENILTGTIHRNANGIVEATIEDGWFQSNFIAGDASTPCRSAGQKAVVKTNLTSNPVTAGTGIHYCVKTIATTSTWEIVPRSCTVSTGGEFTFSITVGALTCGFTRTAAITGSFSTSSAHTAVAELKMVGEPLFSTDKVPNHSGLCPATGSLANFNFDLYTDTDTTPASGPNSWPGSITDPLYLSTS
jgi:hypothetical protein